MLYLNSGSNIKFTGPGSIPFITSVANQAHYSSMYVMWNDNAMNAMQ